MNADLIRRWNKKVTPKDMVYYLGDFGLGAFDYLKHILSNLNRKKIILIRGNHDRSNRTMLNMGFDEVHSYMDLKIQKRKLFLSHVPMKSNYHDINICGHVHEKMRINGNIFNCGVDVNNFEPISIEELFVDFWKSLERGNFIPMDIEIGGKECL